MKSWTAGKDSNESAEIQSAFNAGGALRERLTELLDQKIQLREKERRSKDLYSSPNWQYEQADINGYNRALEYVISLIKS